MLKNKKSTSSWTKNYKAFVQVGKSEVNHSKKQRLPPPQGQDNHCCKAKIESPPARNCYAEAEAKSIFHPLGQTKA